MNSSESPEFREIERRFLVDVVPAAVLTSPFSGVEQGYLSGYPVTVRLRRVIGAGQGAFLTVKRGVLPNREEREVALTSDQFDVLWPATAGWRIEKTRYRFPLGEYVVELDVFCGIHTGLVIAEVEFPNLITADAFIPPDWFGLEITHDSAYSNARLAAGARDAAS